MLLVGLVPCFHRKSKKDVADKDKGNKGNFYTVTPKMNGVGAASAASANGNASNASNAAAAADDNDPPEAVEAQQFFQHMIQLQKNQGTLGQGRRRTQEQQQQQQETAINSSDSNNLDSGYPRRTAFARALSPYNHIYMEIDPTDGPGGNPVYEPLTQSETYMMSTVSDLSEDGGYGGLGSGGVVNYSDLSSRQSSSRESRPLIARTMQQQQQQHERNLLHTISGVLHSQSVRIAHSNNMAQAAANNSSSTLGPARRSMLVATRPQQQQQQQFLQVQQQQQQQQVPHLHFQGSQTLGRLAGQRAFREQQFQQQQQQHQHVPLQVDRLPQAPPEGAGGIPLQRLNVAGAATLRKLPEGSILGRLAQEQQQQQQQQQGAVQVTTMDGSQFVCLNLQQQQQRLHQPTYITGTCSDTYVPFLPSSPPAVPAALVTSRFAPGRQVHAAVHSGQQQQQQQQQQVMDTDGLPIGRQA